MKQNQIPKKSHLSGIDKMAIEFLSRSLVDSEIAEISLPQITYTAKCKTIEVNGETITITTINRNNKSFCEIHYNHETEKETINFYGVD